MPERWLPNPPPYPPSPPLQWPVGAEPGSAAEARPEPATEPVPARLPLAAVVVGVAVVAALATLVILLLVRPPRNAAVATRPSTSAFVVPSSPSTSQGAPSTLPGGPPVLTEAQLEQALPAFTGFVERHRGLRFKSAPTVRLDASAEYVRSWEAYLRTDKPLLDHMDVAFTAFGLNPSNTDLVQAQQTWLGDQTVAYYDPRTKVLHVRAVPYTTYVKETLVGQLTRSLDDQWFSIGRLDPRVGLGEPQFGLATLLSGDDQYVGNVWLASQPFDAQQAAQAEAAARVPNVSDPTLVPLSFAHWLSDPDTAALDLIEALRDHGGEPAVDAAFSDPPGGSQQALAPSRFLDGEKPLAVPAPTAPAKVVASGAWGQLLLQEALIPTVDSDLLSAAMDGYRGDATVGWTTANESCIRIRIGSRDVNGSQAMQQAVAEWVKAVHGTSSTLPDPTRSGQTLVEATVCHPNGGGSSPTTTTTTPSPGGPPGSDAGAASNL